MHERILVVDGNQEQRQDLCTLLEQKEFRTTQLDSLANLEENFQHIDCRVVLLDLDSLPIDNRFIKKLRRQKPGVHIVGLSSHSFHPELEEALSQHIQACLGKPVDEEELLFWVKSLLEVNGSH